MRQTVISFRVPEELAKVFNAFVQDKFGGSTSDAARFILSHFLFETYLKKRPDVVAVMAVYASYGSKIVQKLNDVSHRTEEVLRQEVMKIFNQSQKE